MGLIFASAALKFKLPQTAISQLGDFSRPVNAHYFCQIIERFLLSYKVEYCQLRDVAHNNRLGNNQRSADLCSLFTSRTCTGRTYIAEQLHRLTASTVTQYCWQAVDCNTTVQLLILHNFSWLKIQRCQSQHQQCHRLHSHHAARSHRGAAPTAIYSVVSEMGMSNPTSNAIYCQ
jgi:hypothetical protein